ncbi:NAD(P)/FAD-dependent oxidoreductase [Gorillibacterium sp. sgz5001074]|uniref:NAD(P)/FAD-dependent oxidoreductase n=1 Tax=Gorillibacterium sp. sgz5001074 TaxID=3446695 RepID=UPI003F664F3D
MSYDFECAIIGGGPAGLNAALVLGRARRTVVLIDDARPRNAVTHASHGFLTRDGVTPSEFRRIAYEEVLRYPSVVHRPAEVRTVSLAGGGAGFNVTTSDGAPLRVRKLLMATGLKEALPDIPGLKELYGKSLFQCPYCDGWELRDQPLILVSGTPRLFHMAKLLYQWSRDLTVCTNGFRVLEQDQRKLLADRGIRLIEQPVAAFRGSGGKLIRVDFADGSSLARTGGFITPHWLPQNRIVQGLGCEMTDGGGIRTDAWGRSSLPGLYAAGESATGASSQLIAAAASGSQAAVAINTDLTEEEWRGSAHG